MMLIKSNHSLNQFWWFWVTTHTYHIFFLKVMYWMAI